MHRFQRSSSRRRELYIAVMGVTGAGKSTFIQTASQLLNVGIGHDLNSYTDTVDSYSFDSEGIRITLIDTPGFNDTELNESDVLKSIADWLDYNYRNPPKIKLNGIIYLQSIMDPRMTGSSLRNLKMFRDLCGVDPLKNVLLVTTRWGEAWRVGKVDLAQRHENQLFSDPKFWASMIECGAGTDRFEDTMESALRIIMRLQQCEPVPLLIQSEMVDQDKQLSETAAGMTVNEEILALEKKYKEEIADLQQQWKEAEAAQSIRMQKALDQAREESQRKLDRVYEQQDALHYERRARSRQYDDDMQDLRAQNTQLMALLTKLGADKLDFDDAVQRLEANSGQLRREQREAMQGEINDLKKQPKKSRTFWKLILRILPILGSVAFALLGLPVAPGMLGGLIGIGGDDDA